MELHEVIAEIKQFIPRSSEVPEDAIKALAEVLLRDNTDDVPDSLSDLALGFAVDSDYEHINAYGTGDTNGVFKIGNYFWKFEWESNSYVGVDYEDAKLKLVTKKTRTIEVYE